MACIALQFPGAGPAIRRCVAAAVGRCGHHAGADAELRIGIWGYDTPWTPDTAHGPPLVRWWIGSDAEFMAEGRTRAHSREGRFNWAGTPSIRQALRDHGAEARVVPIVPTIQPRAAPLPDSPLVACYCPEGHEKLYRWRELVGVAARLPDVCFRVYRRTGPRPVTNLACVGHIEPHEMELEYLRARAVLRLVERDGLSLSVQEALSLGRHAVWSHACLPGTVAATTVDGAVAALRQALSRGVNAAGVAAMQALRFAADAKLAAYVEEALG